jgi:hypothetical protein
MFSVRIDAEFAGLPPVRFAETTFSGPVRPAQALARLRWWRRAGRRDERRRNAQATAVGRRLRDAGDDRLSVRRRVTVGGAVRHVPPRAVDALCGDGVVSRVLVEPAVVAVDTGESPSDDGLPRAL